MPCPRGRGSASGSTPQATLSFCWCAVHAARAPPAVPVQPASHLCSAVTASYLCSAGTGAAHQGLWLHPAAEPERWRRRLKKPSSRRRWTCRTATCDTLTLWFAAYTSVHPHVLRVLVPRCMAAVGALALSSPSRSPDAGTHPVPERYPDTGEGHMREPGAHPHGGGHERGARLLARARTRPTSCSAPSARTCARRCRE